MHAFQFCTDMRVAFLQTYPVYHDSLTTEQWLRLENRDRWMPGIVSDMGHTVELWGVDHTRGNFTSHLDGFGDYEIRLFSRTGGAKRTKTHYSDELVEYARNFNPDVCVLKGVDGGAGVRLIDKYLKRENKPFVFVIGGKYYTRHVPAAEVVFYETEQQRAALVNPPRFWRAPVPEHRLIRLPKSIDTSIFKPIAVDEKEWDVISVGRLIANCKKNYEALGPVSEHLRVAVIGSGPAEAELRARFPQINWLGRLPNYQIPAVLNRARIFVFTGQGEYFPRVLVEAAACGLPRVAFAGAITPEVIPLDTGILVEQEHLLDTLMAIINDTDRLQTMGRHGREFAVRTASKYVTREPITRMFELLDTVRKS